MRGIVAQYYWAIRSALKNKPEIKKYLKNCPHCQILFFSHPRNTKRDDIRCPFGCRDAISKKKSTERSTEYNRSKSGKDKKNERNKRRNKSEDSSPSSSQKIKSEDQDETDHSTMIHIQIVIRYIDGFLVSWDGIKSLITYLRQHSMEFRKKLDYSCNKSP